MFDREGHKQLETVAVCGHGLRARSALLREPFDEKGL
jgi:hypothetical protein